MVKQLEPFFSLFASSKNLAFIRNPDEILLLQDAQMAVKLLIPMMILRSIAGENVKWVV